MEILWNSHTMLESQYMENAWSEGEVKLAKVSVIVPVYNTENYLRQCLDSILYQTVRGMEIVV